MYEYYCEYIEDPYNSDLVLKILDRLKLYVEKISNPNRYLRYILNRLHLDGTNIRAASISCLGEMALIVNTLKEEVKSIIHSFLHDLDQEVRDRAFYYNKILCGDEEFTDMHDKNCFNINDLDSIQKLIEGRLNSIEDVDIQDLLNIPVVLG